MVQVLPDAYLDAMLMRYFPGRTLEELDGVNWPRLMRALQAKEIERVEDRLPEFFAGKWKPEPAEWRAIQRHDRLVDDDG